MFVDFFLFYLAFTVFKYIEEMYIGKKGCLRRLGRADTVTLTEAKAMDPLFR